MSGTVFLSPEQVLERCERYVEQVWHRDPANPVVERLSLSPDRTAIEIHWQNGPMKTRSIKECTPIFVLSRSDLN